MFELHLQHPRVAARGSCVRGNVEPVEAAAILLVSDSSTLLPGSQKQ